MYPLRTLCATHSVRPNPFSTHSTRIYFARCNFTFRSAYHHLSLSNIHFQSFAFQSVFPLSCARVRAHTAFRGRAHAYIYCALTYHDETMFSVGKLRKVVFGSAKKTHLAAIFNSFMGFCTNVSHF